MKKEDLIKAKDILDSIETKEEELKTIESLRQTLRLDSDDDITLFIATNRWSCPIPKEAEDEMLNLLYSIINGQINKLEREMEAL